MKEGKWKVCFTSDIIFFNKAGLRGGGATSSESSQKIGCCSLENNTDFKCSLVLQSMAKRVYDTHNSLTAYRIEGELAAFCIEFGAVVIQAGIAIQLPAQLLAFAIILSWLSCFHGCLAS